MSNKSEQTESTSMLSALGEKDKPEENEKKIHPQASLPVADPDAPLPEELRPFPRGVHSHQQYAFLSHDVIIPRGITLEDAIKYPGLWANIANEFSDMDEVRLRSEDETWVAYGIVKTALKQSVQIVLRDKIALEKQDRYYEIFGYVVKWHGPRDRWTVFDPSGTKIKADFGSLSQGMRFAEEHRRNIS